MSSLSSSEDHRGLCRKHPCDISNGSQGWALGATFQLADVAFGVAEFICQFLRLQPRATRRRVSSAPIASPNVRDSRYLAAPIFLGTYPWLPFDAERLRNYSSALHQRHDRLH